MKYKVDKHKIQSGLIFIISALLTCMGMHAELRVSIVTFHPGPEIYQLEGHTGLRIVDTDTGRDVTYNWGTFDFDSPNFVYRFVKGETDYMVAAQPTALLLPWYEAQGRRVVDQQLDLSQAQAQRLQELINENLKEENRRYRYNYVLDNCATRPLAMLEKATGADTIMLAQAPTAGDQSFRTMMRTYHERYPWYQFGIDLALGKGIDRPITNREKSFVPVELEGMLSHAHLVDAATGETYHIVKRHTVIYPGRPGGATLDATPWWLSPSFVCWLFFAIVVALTWRDFVMWHCSRWLDTIVFGIYGLAGLFLTFLIFVSVHEATSPNWLYLWLNPLCLIGAVGEWIRRWHNVVISWQILNFALVFALMVLALSSVQELNPAFWPLMMASMLRSVNYVNLKLGHALPWPIR